MLGRQIINIYTHKFKMNLGHGTYLGDLVEVLSFESEMIHSNHKPTRLRLAVFLLTLHILEKNTLLHEMFLTYLFHISVYSSTPYMAIKEERVGLTWTDHITGSFDAVNEQR